MDIKKISRWSIHFLVAFLPWSVAFSVLSTERLNIDIFRFSKEIIIACIACLYVYEVIKRKIKIQIDIFDMTILCFILTLITVSIWKDVPIKGIMYGLRYDIGFLCVIMLFRRALPLWDIPLSAILKTFLISGGYMLVFGLLIRYVFDETILTLIGFSDQVSIWNGGGPPPIYHGIAGAAVVRFQGLLEGPNQMAFFLLIYLGSYMTLFAQKKQYFFMNFLVVSILLFLLIQTYSRSGYLGALFGGVYVIVYSIFIILKSGNIVKRYKITFGKIIAFLVVSSCIGLVFMLQFGNKIAPIFARHGSTSGHFERMYIGLLRFGENPFGQGLAQAGPSSRAVFSVNQDPVSDTIITDSTVIDVLSTLREKNPDFIFNTETYYIPESWYIQIMIEGGVLGAILFAVILLSILAKLQKNKYILGATLGIYIMNLFLHSFESVHTAFIWSIVIAGSMMILQNNSEKEKSLRENILG